MGERSPARRARRGGRSISVCRPAQGGGHAGRRPRRGRPRPAGEHARARDRRDRRRAHRDRRRVPGEGPGCAHGGRRRGDRARPRRRAHTLYNTYWVRFERGPVSFARAVANSAALFRAAEEAGVRRVVHVSVSNPSDDSPLPYFRGKARVERALRESGLSHAIVRPTLVFGPDDLLVNNIAWILRRFPLFLVPGDGAYDVQ